MVTDAPLKAVEADDMIWIRGIVQEIRVETFVVVVPAVVIPMQSRGEQ